VADALIRDPNRDFWAEVKKIRCSKAGSVTVDGCCDESSITQLFARKYRDLFTSVPYQQLDLQSVVADVDAQLLFDSRCFIASSDVLRAISKLKLHRDDGDLGLASDYFVYAGPDLSTQLRYCSLVSLFMVMYAPLFLSALI